MGPLLAQLVRIVATQVIKCGAKQATKQVTKQAGKQVAKQVSKQVGKSIKNNNVVGGKSVNVEKVGERLDIGGSKQFDSLDQILKNNQMVEHQAKQTVSNYKTLNLPGGMSKQKIFNFPNL